LVPTASSKVCDQRRLLRNPSMKKIRTTKTTITIKGSAPASLKQAEPSNMI